MKTLIKEITLQVIEEFNQFTVFTKYERNGNSYDGFTPYKTLEKAMFEAKNMANFWNADFMSTANGYTLKTFELGGAKKVEFINTKSN